MNVLLFTLEWDLGRLDKAVRTLSDMIFQKTGLQVLDWI